MKNEAKISMDYNRTISMANNLLELASQFKKITQEDAIAQLNTLNSNWKGENSEHFIRKASGYLQSKADVADQLEELANSIKINAQNVYNAEMQALRIARERTYN